MLNISWTLDHCPSSQVVDVPLKPAPKAAPAVDDDGGDDDHRYSMGIYCQYIYINMLYIIYIILFTYLHRWSRTNYRFLLSFNSCFSWKFGIHNLLIRYAYFGDHGTWGLGAWFCTYKIRTPQGPIGICKQAPRARHSNHTKVVLNSVEHCARMRMVLGLVVEAWICMYWYVDM